MPHASVKITPAAVALGLLLAAGATAHPPRGIVVDPQGQVYFSDLETVWKVDARGRLSVFRPGPGVEGGRHTHELNIDEAGNVYGEDSMYEPATGRYTAAIWKMTPAGAFSYVFAPAEPPNGLSLWRGRDGSTYSTLRRNNTRGLLLLKRSADGVVTVLVGDREAAAQVRQEILNGAGGMAFGADGTLYFSDGASVMKLTPGGEVSALARDIPGEKASGDDRAAAPSTAVFGLAVDASGNVFAADLGGRRVLKITPRGEVSTVARVEQPWLPSGVAVRGGDVYVLEAGPTRGTRLSMRVRLLSPDGRTTLLATAGENVTRPLGPKPDTPSEDAPAPSARRTPYTFIALGAGVVVLALLIWLASRARGGAIGSEP